MFPLLLKQTFKDLLFESKWSCHVLHNLATINYGFPVKCFVVSWTFVTFSNYTLFDSYSFMFLYVRIRTEYSATLVILIQQKILIRWVFVETFQTKAMNHHLVNHFAQELGKKLFSFRNIVNISINMGGGNVTNPLSYYQILIFLVFEEQRNWV